MNDLEKWADAEYLCKRFFNEDIYSYQKEIIETIILNLHLRNVCTAATRAGKSWSVAKAAVLKAVFRPNHSVGIIATTYDKTKTMMNYIADNIIASPYIASLTDFDVNGGDIERLKREVSKRKITFKNGSYIEVITADVKGQGFALMGRGYNTILVDESPEIPDVAYSKILRMAGESADAQIFEIGNPWFLGNHFHRNWKDPNSNKIHISYEQCIKERRLKAEYVEEMRQKLTPLEFRVLYEAKFPEEMEKSIYLYQWIEEAREDQDIEIDEIYIGCDVARGGLDRTVFTVIGYNQKENKIKFLDYKALNRSSTMEVVGDLALFYDSIKDKYSKEVSISVDTVGLGAGVYDRLLELDYPVRPFIAGEKAKSSRFSNIKTEYVFSLAKYFEEKRFCNLPSQNYPQELVQWQYATESDKKLRVIDPTTKSPDFADSLVIAFSLVELLSYLKIEIKGMSYGGLV